MFPKKPLTILLSIFTILMLLLAAAATSYGFGFHTNTLPEFKLFLNKLFGVGVAVGILGGGALAYALKGSSILERVFVFCLALTAYAITVPGFGFFGWFLWQARHVT